MSEIEVSEFSISVRVLCGIIAVIDLYWARRSNKGIVSAGLSGENHESQYERENVK